jgi:hypothetical protein
VLAGQLTPNDTNLLNHVFAVIYIVTQVLIYNGLRGMVPVYMEIAMYAATVGMNFIVTAMICLRLIWFSRRENGLVDGRSSRLYNNIVIILVESAAPFCVLGIVTCVITSVGNSQYVDLVTLLWYSACVSTSILLSSRFRNI